MKDYTSSRMYFATIIVLVNLLCGVIADEHNHIVRSRGRQATVVPDWNAFSQRQGECE